MSLWKFISHCTRNFSERKWIQKKLLGSQNWHIHKTNKQASKQTNKKTQQADIVDPRLLEKFWKHFLFKEGTLAFLDERKQALYENSWKNITSSKKKAIRLQQQQKKDWNLKSSLEALTSIRHHDKYNMRILVYTVSGN